MNLEELVQIGTSKIKQQEILNSFFNSLCIHLFISYCDSQDDPKAAAKSFIHQWRKSYVELVDKGFAELDKKADGELTMFMEMTGRTVDQMKADHQDNLNDVIALLNNLIEKAFSPDAGRDEAKD